MIAFDPVAQEQKCPAGHEKRSAQNPFGEKKQNEAGENQGDADAVQQFVPAGRVFAIVLRHVVRQTQSAPPVGGQLLRKGHCIPNREKWLEAQTEGKRLQVAAAFHSFQHGDFVGVFQIGPNGDAHADASDANPQWLQ